MLDIFEQWIVTIDGLEAKDESYFIDGERLGETVDLNGEVYSDWLFHMSEKDWVNYPDFVKAFTYALAIHSHKYEPLPSHSVYISSVLGFTQRAKIYNETFPEFVDLKSADERMKVLIEQNNPPSTKYATEILSKSTSSRELEQVAE